MIICFKKQRYNVKLILRKFDLKALIFDRQKNCKLSFFFAKL